MEQTTSPPIKRRKMAAVDKINISPGGSTCTTKPQTCGMLEVAFSFDTTRSMNPCIAQVRKQLVDIITRLFAEIPCLRIAVIAHGDYCDISTSYVTKRVDFTEDVKKLCDFVKNVGGTGAGDQDKCYELVLHQVRTQLSWSPGTQRVLVLIGDGCPHPPSYPLNKDGIDWEKETAALSDIMRVHIYSVMCRCQCLDFEKEEETKRFYSHLAERTGGTVLKLHNFSTILDIMVAISCRETGPDVLEVYEREVRAREGF